jgi:hypothetical protein
VRGTAGTRVLTPGPRRLRVAVPWLGRAAREAAGTGAVRLPAAEWLLSRAQRQSAAPGWREWLAGDAPFGVQSFERFPAGPCVRAAWTGQRPSGSWACAAPVHLLTGLDHLRLAAPAPLPLEPEESATLVEDINARLAGGGFTLHNVAGRGWVCECPAGVECEAPEPALAVGGNLRDLMPAGRDARRVRAWVNEVQMVLHEHPVNERRGARGLPVANSVWLWGFGTAGEPQDAPDALLLTDDDWLAGLWQLHGAVPGAPDTLASALAGAAREIRLGIAEPPASVTPAMLAGLEQAVFAPIRAAIAGRRLHAVAIHTGRAVHALEGNARWRFWRPARPLAEVLQ